MYGGSIQGVQACIEPVTTDIDVINILCATDKRDLTRVGASKAIRTAGHPYAKRLINQAQSAKVSFDLPYDRWENTLGLSECQPTGREGRTCHGKTTCAYFSGVCRDTICGKQSCQWAPLHICHISKEYVLLRGQANTSPKFLNSVPQTPRQPSRSSVLDTP